jgi:formyltetrahydrofolate hydrolase
MAWFFMRVEWDLESFGIARASIEAEFRKALAGDENFRLYFSDQRARMAVFVSLFIEYSSEGVLK